MVAYQRGMFANCTHNCESSGEKIFLLALFYHLLTTYIGVGDYLLSNTPTSCLIQLTVSA